MHTLIDETQKRRNQTGPSNINTLYILCPHQVSTSSTIAPFAKNMFVKHMSK
jgi:hypothetical protein